VIYLHDGTFEGVLTGIYTMFHSKSKVGEGKLLPYQYHQSDIFELTLPVASDSEKAYKVAHSIHQTFGKETFERVFYAFLSEEESYGTTVFNFLKKAYKIGPGAIEALGDPDVLKLNQLYTKVSREAHLMLGLLRFSELKSGIYYAQYEPTYHLTMIIAEHFSKRLGDQTWVIHDTKRHFGAFFDQNEYYFSPIDQFEDLEVSKKEAGFQAMWRTYVEHISIEARKNPKCQMNHMPKKYWKFLTEKVV